MRGGSKRASGRAREGTVRLLPQNSNFFKDCRRSFRPRFISCSPMLNHRPLPHHFDVARNNENGLMQK